MDSIQFTMETERDQQIALLDVEVKRVDRGLTSSVYRKKTEAATYISVHTSIQEFFQEHSSIQKSGWLRSVNQTNKKNDNISTQCVPEKWFSTKGYRPNPEEGNNGDCECSLVFICQ